MVSLIRHSTLTSEAITRHYLQALNERNPGAIIIGLTNTPERCIAFETDNFV